jgi:hypothetical protein
MEQREKSFKTGELGLCLANCLAKPPVEPREVPRYGKETFLASAFATNINEVKLRGVLREANETALSHWPLLGVEDGRVSL